MTLPKENKRQRKDFQFIFVYVLESNARTGESVKLTVGVREKPLRFLQYCITQE